MIHEPALSWDEAGFPVVTWREDRNLHGPEPYEQAPVGCRIMRAGKGIAGITEGSLMFVACGSVRDGRFEEGKPWEHLSGFAIKTAEMFVAPGEHGLFETVMETIKSPLARAAVRKHARDQALVIEAQFGPFADPIYVNCAHASRSEVNKLHALLVRQFVAGRGSYTAQVNRGRFVWPQGDARLPVYDGLCSRWENRRVRPVADERLAWVLPGLATALIIGAIAFWARG